MVSLNHSKSIACLIDGGKGKKDTYWGVNTITWKGENRLGLILMDLREAFRKEMLI